MSVFLSHIKMLSDKARLDTYRRAILQTVRRGDVVADIGTGTGILAFFAIQAGAKRVYAIEPGPIIDVAKKMAMENGFYDRVEFIQNDSRKMEPPERVDVIITETIGVLGIDEGVMELLYDARNRILTTKGKIIPASLSLLAVPATIKKGHPFSFLDDAFYDIQTSSLKDLAVNNVYGMNVGPHDRFQLLSQPAAIFETDFHSCRPPNFPLHMDGSFQCTNQGILHGMLVFPEIYLTEDITLSLYKDNGFLHTHWDISFFPITEQTVISRGERVSFRLTFTEKNGLVWRFFIGERDQKRIYTQLSAFGLPSLRFLKPD